MVVVVWCVLISLDDWLVQVWVNWFNSEMGYCKFLLNKVVQILDLIKCLIQIWI